MTVTREQVAWAAGLFEGEGYISFGGNGIGKSGRLRLGLGMTDPDRVELFQAIVGVGSCHIVRKRQPHHKETLKWSTTNFEQAQAVITMLWPWLGPRRRAAARNGLLLTQQVRDRLQASRLYCKRGHLKDDANVYVWRGTNGRHGQRQCRECARIRGRKTDSRPERRARKR